jgi:hypothetical protein
MSSLHSPRLFQSPVLTFSKWVFNCVVII